jgi:hypothetical protein
MVEAQRRLWFAGIGGAAAGLVAGYLLFGIDRKEPHPTASTSGPTTSASASPASGSAPQTPNTPPRVESPMPGSKPPNAPPSIDPTEMLIILQGRVSQLEKQVTQLGGAPLKAPPNIDDRFKERPLTAALLSALREVGAESRLTALDCTEYPCVAYFDGLTTAEVDALKKTSAASAYAHDRWITFSTVGPDGPYNAAAVFPRDDSTSTSELDNRLRNRVREVAP